MESSFALLTLFGYVFVRSAGCFSLHASLFRCSTSPCLLCAFLGTTTTPGFRTTVCCAFPSILRSFPFTGSAAVFLHRPCCSFFIRLSPNILAASMPICYKPLLRMEPWALWVRPACLSLRHFSRVRLVNGSTDPPTPRSLFLHLISASLSLAGVPPSFFLSGPCSPAYLSLPDPSASGFILTLLRLGFYLGWCSPILFATLTITCRRFRLRVHVPKTPAASPGALCNSFSVFASRLLLFSFLREVGLFTLSLVCFLLPLLLL